MYRGKGEAGGMAYATIINHLFNASDTVLLKCPTKGLPSLVTTSHHNPTTNNCQTFPFSPTSNPTCPLH